MPGKPMPMKKYASFDLWKSDQTSKHKKLVTLLQALVKKSAPKLVESVKWGNGVWVDGESPIAYLHSEEDHLQFGFFAGASLSDPKGLLQGSGKFVRHIKLRKAADIDETAFSKLVRQAVKARS